jgi:hypothetical protein
MSRLIIVILLYHRQKPIDPINKIRGSKLWKHWCTVKKITVIKQNREAAHYCPVSKYRPCPNRSQQVWHCSEPVTWKPESISEEVAKMWSFVLSWNVFKFQLTLRHFWTDEYNVHFTSQDTNFGDMTQESYSTDVTKYTDSNPNT